MGTSTLSPVLGLRLCEVRASGREAAKSTQLDLPAAMERVDDGLKTVSTMTSSVFLVRSDARDFLDESFGSSCFCRS